MTFKRVAYLCALRSLQADDSLWSRLPPLSLDAHVSLLSLQAVVSLFSLVSDGATLAADSLAAARAREADRALVEGKRLQSSKTKVINEHNC